MKKIVKACLLALLLAGGNTQVYLDKAEIRQYYVTRERQSYSLAADYKFNANHSISFKGIYNRRSDWENRYRMTFKKLNDEPKDMSILGVSTN